MMQGKDINYKKGPYSILNESEPEALCSFQLRHSNWMVEAVFIILSLVIWCFVELIQPCLSIYATINGYNSFPGLSNYSTESQNSLGEICDLHHEIAIGNCFVGNLFQGCTSKYTFKIKQIDVTASVKLWLVWYISVNVRSWIMWIYFC